MATTRPMFDDSDELTRAQVDAMRGLIVLEFGTGWCGYCRVARPLFEHVRASHERVRHIVIEDGRGKRLGRSFGVKLWPTFVFLRDGREVARVVRPRDERVLEDAFAKLG